MIRVTRVKIVPKILKISHFSLELGKTMESENSIYEVAIVGGGISGTALLYSLSNYTNLNHIALIEKNQEVALVNSHKTSNSQTLHFGDIETNYTLEKAQKVRKAASLVKNYILRNDTQQERIVSIIRWS